MFNLTTKPVSAGELMKKEKKPINFVVEKFISQGVHFLAGHPKSGKSWLSLWLALCVSNGNNLWGFKTNKSKVLYFCLEDTENRIQDRLEGMPGCDTDNLLFMYDAPNMDNGFNVFLKKIVKEEPEIKLVIVDTFQLIRGEQFAGNAYACEYAEMNYLKRLAKELDITSTNGVIIINIDEHELAALSSLTELKKLSEEKLYGRGRLVGELYWVCEGKQDLLQSGLLNDLINRNRIKIKTIVDKTVGRFAKKGKNINIDYVISSTINLKTSYIEHQFYGKVSIIKYFMQLEKVLKTYIEQLDSKVLGAIEQLYFSSSKQKKMLMDIGIYERDVDSVISIIGDDFDETFEMKKRLIEKIDVLKNDISYISTYIIRNL